MAKVIKFLRDDLISIFRNGIKPRKSYGFTIFDDHNVTKGKQLQFVESSFFDYGGPATSAYVSGLPSGMFEHANSIWRIIVEITTYLTFFGRRFNGYLNEKEDVKTTRTLITQIQVSTERNVTGFITHSEKKRLRLILALYWIISFFLYRKTAVVVTHKAIIDRNLPPKDLSLNGVTDECYRIDVDKDSNAHIVWASIRRPMKMLAFANNVYGWGTKTSRLYEPQSKSSS